MMMKLLIDSNIFIEINLPENFPLKCIWKNWKKLINTCIEL